MGACDDHNDLVGRIYDAAADDAVWPTLGQLFRGAFDAQSFIVLSVAAAPRPEEPPDLRVMASDWQDGAFERYLGFWFQHDPWLQAAAHVAEFVPVLGQELYSQDRFARLPIWNDFSRPELGIFWLLTGIVSVVDGRRTAVSLHRGPDAPSFGAAEKGELAALLPHIARAARLRQALGEARDLARMGLELLAGLGTAACILKADGRVLLANACAERLAREADGFGLLANGRLALAFRADRLRFERELQRLGAARPRSGSFALLAERPSGRAALQILVTPIPASLADEADGDFLMLVRDPEAPARLPPGRLADLFALTARESEVLAELATGADLETIARTLGIGIGTVRCHVKRLFVKTGCRRQRDLADLVARSPLALDAQSQD